MLLEKLPSDVVRKVSAFTFAAPRRSANAKTAAARAKEEAVIGAGAAAAAVADLEGALRVLLAFVPVAQHDVVRSQMAGGWKPHRVRSLEAVLLQLLRA